MRYIEGDRKILLDIFLAPSKRPAPRDLFTLGDARLMSQAELVCLLPDDPSGWSLPLAVITHDGSEVDLLAWAATYIPLKPFTSVVRVLGRAEAKFIVSRTRTPGSPLIFGLIGVILAEMLIKSDHKRGVVFDLSNAYTSYSFAAALCLGRGFYPDVVNVLSERWALAHSNGVSSPLILAVQRLFSVLSSLSDLDSRLQPSLFSDDPESLVLAIASFVLGDGVDGGLPSMRSRRARFERATVEDRVRLFSDAVADVLNGPDFDRGKWFRAAYFANQINPGTFDHFALLQETTDGNAEALLWYGFLAGVQSRSRMAGWANGLAWRLLSELSQEFDSSQRTRADINALEWAMLRAGFAGRTTIRPAFPPHLVVELLPGVYTRVAFESAPSLPSRVARDPLEELRISLQRAMDSLRDLQRSERGRAGKKPDRRKAEG